MHPPTEIDTMVTQLTPAEVIQAQLDAYNAHDLQRWLNTYAPEARQFEFPDKLLAMGHAQIRERMVARYADPTLHAHLIQRTVIGQTVVDHERITRQTPEGTPGQLELMAIYDVQNGLIQTATFVFGPFQPQTTTP
jgi:putative hydrolase of HD superfamily